MSELDLVSVNVTPPVAVVAVGTAGDTPPSSLWRILSNVFGMFYGNTESNQVDGQPIIPTLPDLDEHSILDGWEWILSNAEANFNLRQVKRKQHVQKEMDKLRRISQNVKLRPYIMQAAQSLYSTLDLTHSRALIHSRLDSSLRDRILKDLIRDQSRRLYTLVSQIVKSHYLRKHLTLLSRQVDQEGVVDSVARVRLIIERGKPRRGSGGSSGEPHPLDQERRLLLEDLQQRWISEKYSLNICGEMCSFCLISSQVAEKEGLGYHVVGDILWTMSLSLCRELTSLVERSLHQHENQIVCDYIVGLFNPLIELWYTTTVNTGTVSSRLGRVKVEKKREVIISARFDQGNDPLVRSSFKAGSAPVTTATVTLFKKVEMLDKISDLSNLLTFHRHRGSVVAPRPRVVSSVITSEEFSLRTKILRESLVFRSAPPVQPQGLGPTSNTNH